MSKACVHHMEPLKLKRRFNINDKEYSIVILFFLLIVFTVLLGSELGNDTALRKKRILPDENTRMVCFYDSIPKGVA